MPLLFRSEQLLLMQLLAQGPRILDVHPDCAAVSCGHPKIVAAIEALFGEPAVLAQYWSIMRPEGAGVPTTGEAFAPGKGAHCELPPPPSRLSPRRTFAPLPSCVLALVRRITSLHLADRAEVCAVRRRLQAVAYGRLLRQVDVLHHPLRRLHPGGRPLRRRAGLLPQDHHPPLRRPRPPGRRGAGPGKNLLLHHFFL